jgi:Spy/CpxP family protein refolding chaperone
MKPTFRSILPAALAATFLAASAAFLTAAEPDPGAPRRPGNPPGAPPADGPRGPRPFPGQFQGQGPMMGGGGGGVQVEAVLNQEQRLKFGEELQGQREKMREINERYGRLRRELDEALFGEKLDEGLVRKKSAELAELDAERSLIRARAFAKVRPTLSEEQLERLKNMRAEAGRMNRPGEGGFRQPPQQPRPARPPEGRENEDVLPPPRPPAPPPK